MMSLILLIGEKTDPHIKAICSNLTEYDEQFVVLDKINFSDYFSVTFEDGNFESKINIDNKLILNSEIKSVWNSTALKVIGKNKLSIASQKFANVEWTEGINSLWKSLDTFWVNNPANIISSANRIYQLDIANKVGLVSPKTLITNNPDDLRQFYDDCNGEIISKTLGSSEGLPEGKMIFTNKISDIHLKNIENLRYAPTMFQRYIPKKTELRITMIDSKIHTVEIYSQKSETTKHDWRHYDDFKKTPYIPITLDDNVYKKLKNLMKNLGLVYGAIDMIKTPDDELIFLEVNANGRWYWIQELTKIDIAKDIALALVK